MCDLLCILTIKWPGHSLQNVIQFCDVHFKCDIFVLPRVMHQHCGYWWPGALSTRSSVATVLLTIHPCVCIFLWVKHNLNGTRPSTGRVLTKNLDVLSSQFLCLPMILYHWFIPFKLAKSSRNIAALGVVRFSQTKYQSSVSLALFVWGIHHYPHKGTVIQKVFTCHD